MYFRYIFKRGVETITNVFVGMLEYTMNADLSLYHSQKAFYFYVEFIEQITDSQNSFLQLTSRDAVMFVYKRTIFEINKEMVKNKGLNQCQVVLSLNVFCDILKTCIYNFISNTSFIVITKEEKNAIINTFITFIRETSDKTSSFNVESLNLVLTKTNELYDHSDDSQSVFTNLLSFVKKIQKY